MTLNSFSGGIDTSLSTKLNENFEEVQIQGDEGSTDTTEVSVVTTTWSTLRTHTFTPSQDAILMMVKVDYDVKSENAANSADSRVVTSIGTIDQSPTTSTSYVNKTGSVGGASGIASSFNITYQVMGTNGGYLNYLKNMKTTVYYLFPKALTTSSGTITFA